MLAVIRCEHVSKRFSERAEQGDKKARLTLGGRRRAVYALSDVSLRVDTGEILGILGANGSGKSTLIRVISTLLFPDEGLAEVFGLDVCRHPMEIRQRISRVSVEASFFKKLSALENLVFSGRLYGVSRRETVERATYVLTRLGFSERKMRASLENMSRGQQQKVAIARAFLTEPELLLLDEPTTGLDPKSRRDVQDFVEEIKARRTTTIILTTHDMAEAERLCDRIAILDGGKLVALGTSDELKKHVGPEAKTLEDVFFALAGRVWEDGEADEDPA